ncbi:MAG: transporter substrate-binding domain-containing protein [bacterium]|jgi:ABC-type amino acid transport substrate-binding protein|nr:transporter substrate-binding domain-containing protein [bacterium]
MRPIAILLLLASVFALSAAAQTVPAKHDLPEIKASGQLRHLGIPYANFITGAGDGLDVDLVKMFCRELGVEYVYVETDWSRTYSDVTGLAFTRKGNEVTITGPAEVRGDMIAHGMTDLPWRRELVNFAEPMFPTQIWLIAPATAKIAPIAPTGTLDGDIALTYRLINGISVLAKPNTCLDPKLYDLSGHGALVVNYEGSLNHMAPNLLGGMADLTILDVPDALVALRRWQGKIKILGPLSEPQYMAAAFPKNSPQLEAAFAAFLNRCQADGTYDALVRKYYPGVWTYFPDFFTTGSSVQ